MKRIVVILLVILACSGFDASAQRRVPRSGFAQPPYGGDRYYGGGGYRGGHACGRACFQWRNVIAYYRTVTYYDECGMPYCVDEPVYRRMRVKVCIRF